MRPVARGLLIAVTVATASLAAVAASNQDGSPWLWHDNRTRAHSPDEVRLAPRVADRSQFSGTPLIVQFYDGTTRQLQLGDEFAGCGIQALNDNLPTWMVVFCADPSEFRTAIANDSRIASVTEDTPTVAE